MGCDIISSNKVFGKMARPRHLLPNEPRALASSDQSELTERYLLPALKELELFFLAVRTHADLELQRAQPVKLGKPYPLGQCLEIAQAVEKRLKRLDALNLDSIAAQGYVAFSAFLSSGGIFRQVWGDLRGEFFQNAFQLGTLYVDVSNDTVVPTKPKVEIMSFADAQFAAITDFRHFSRIAVRYWKGNIFPNHVLPELAPYCPLLHVSPTGVIRVHDATRYMVSLVQAGQFQASEDVLRDPGTPIGVFEYIAKALKKTKLKLASSPEEGRERALQMCSKYRTKRWHVSQSQTKRIMVAVLDINHQLTTSAQHVPFAANAVLTATVPSLNKVKNMPQYIPVSKVQMAGKRWKRYANYYFAAYDTIIPLVVEEIPKAVMAMPIGFVSQGETFIPVAVQSLAPRENFFVTSDGRWIGNYIPAAYRGYPFALSNVEDGQQVLCIDQASGLITEDLQGELFFNDDGTPAQAVEDVFNFLEQLLVNREATARICAVLQKHQLIQPWLIEVQNDDGESKIEGLFRIDEAAFNALQSDAFEEIRRAGGLPLAYCQLLSMQHLSQLSQLYRERVKTQAQMNETLLQKPTGEINLDILSNGGTFRFGIV